VVATGTVEQPLVFPGNDLVGVMLPGAVRRLVEDWAVKPGSRAVVIGADERGCAVTTQLAAAGVDVARVVDLRESPVVEIAAEDRRGRLAAVTVDGNPLPRDLPVASGARQPAYSLLAQAGARVEYDPTSGTFVPVELPAGVEAVGSVAGRDADVAVPAASYNGARGKCFACLCEDVTEKD